MSVSPRLALLCCSAPLIVLSGCGLYEPVPLLGKAAEQLFQPFSPPVADDDTGGELPIQEPGTVLGELRYGQRSESLGCSFRWRIEGESTAEFECPACDLQWEYRVTYTWVDEALSDDCAALPWMASTAYSVDFLTDYFNTSGPIWMLGDRSGAPYFFLGGPGYSGYYYYGAEPGYGATYFRAILVSYDVTDNPALGTVDWDVSFGGSYYYYGDDARDALEYYLGGTASPR